MQPARVTSTSEKSRCGYSVSATEKRRPRCAAVRPQAGRAGARISTQRPVNITWIGSSVRASSSGRCSARNARLASKNAPVPRVLPVDPLEHDLALARPVEHHRRRRPVRRGGRQHVTRGVARQQVAHLASSPSQFLTTAPLLRMSVSGPGSASKTGRAKSIAPAGRQRHFDARGDSPANGVAVRRRNPSGAVEDRAVDIEGEQTDHYRQTGPYSSPGGRRSISDCTGWGGRRLRRSRGSHGGAEFTERPHGESRMVSATQRRLGRAKRGPARPPARAPVNSAPSCEPRAPVPSAV